MAVKYKKSIFKYINIKSIKKLIKSITLGKNLNDQNYLILLVQRYFLKIFKYDINY